MHQDFLSNVLLFAGLSGDDLISLTQMVEEVHLEEGDELFKEGSSGDHAYVIRYGQIDVFKAAPEGEKVLAVLGEGEILGEMSLVEKGPRTAGARARNDSLLLAISREHFYQLLETSSAAALGILQTIIKRLRSTESMLRESEKLAQLGTITASVAHELDDPAASTQKGAEQLREVMNQLGPVRLRLYEIGLSLPQLDVLFTLEKRLHRQASSMIKMDEVEQRDREIQLEDALTGLGISDAMNIAPMLVNLNYTAAQVDDLAEKFTPSQLMVALIWLSKSYQMYSLLEKIRQGSRRVADISQALKTYSDMEEATFDEVDIYDELEDALLNFRRELKAGVSIQRDYDRNLPSVHGYPDELNQMLVHLIDNAIDAMGYQGTITLRTYQQDHQIVVEIEDDGPGIPSSLQNRVFDPFFTTKEPGEGMGLGLHISQKIVNQMHSGELELFSVPHKTCFTVKLPMN
ncbi:ATP-binding protein [Anaerolineales bacterium HSG6]|nr:ATP-binding protein [Anaerolineales bacterium HSG6]MDM8531142.1 ATP-binding protein [Anaerolineales bacterium HSG25]